VSAVTYQTTETTGRVSPWQTQRCASRWPTALLLASLSSCYALALVWAARKRGLELPDLEVAATGSYAGQKFGALVLTVRTSLPAELVEPLLEPAKRVCYVSNTFAHVPVVDVALAAPTPGL
jgi:putative redox protein